MHWSPQIPEKILSSQKVFCLAPQFPKVNSASKPILSKMIFSLRMFKETKSATMNIFRFFYILFKSFVKVELSYHTGQCKRTSGCYNELVVAFFSTGGGVKGKKIYTCWLYYLFINLHLFYLWWHLAHRPPVTLQFMALPSNWWYNSWFGLQIQQSSGVLPWQALFSSVTA